jgi:glycosyltransferase involved in cell wall biosynthesis
MRDRIQDELQRGKYDLIICDSIYSLINIPDTTIPQLLNCHNVEYVILRRYARVETNPLKKCYALAESNLMRDAERNGLAQIDGVMACSKDDLEILRTLCPACSVFVVPNVVDTISIQPCEPEGRHGGDRTLLFQGVMDWYPNRDAVQYFARTIFPRIRAECPDVRFVVAGRNPPLNFVEEFRSERKIEFTGTVPDMRPYLEAADVVVVPLRIGGGTRLKILEACAAGRPVVSTTIGAEGLDLRAGKEIIVVDDPSEFARGVVALLRNPVQRSLLSNHARSAVVERYSFSTLEKTIGSVISTFNT